MIDFSGLSLLVGGLTTGLALMIRALAGFRFRRITMCSGGGGEGCAGLRCDCRHHDDASDAEEEKEEGRESRPPPQQQSSSYSSSLSRSSQFSTTCDESSHTYEKSSSSPK